MNNQLSNEDLMDVIMAYDKYIQDSYEKGFFTSEQRPLTVAEFYDNLYPMYSNRPISKYTS